MINGIWYVESLKNELQLQYFCSMLLFYMPVGLYLSLLDTW